MIHTRDWPDVQRKFRMARYLPRKWVRLWCLYWPPVVFSEITGLKSKKTGKEIKGWLIGVPMTAKQLLERRDVAQKRIIQAIKKAEKLGAKIVGLGALTSPVTNGGLVVIPELKGRLPLDLPQHAAFACLGETILLALEDDEVHISLGKVQTQAAMEMLRLSEKYNFMPISLH